MFHNYTKIWQHHFELIEEGGQDFNLKLEFTINNRSRAYRSYITESERYLKVNRLLYLEEDVSHFMEKVRIAKINGTNNVLNYKELYDKKVKGLVEEVRFPLLHWDSETNMFTYHETIVGNSVTHSCLEEIYSLQDERSIEAYLLQYLKTLNIFYYPY